MPISLKNSTSILPWIRYSPQSNAMTVAGEDNKPREVPFLGKAFAIDIENGSMGWLLISEGIARLEALSDRQRPAAIPWSQLQARIFDPALCAEVSREP